MYVLEQLQSTIGKDNLFICITERPGHVEVGDKKKWALGEVAGWETCKYYSAIADAGGVCKYTSENRVQCSD